VAFEGADCSREPGLALFSYASRILSPATVRAILLAPCEQRWDGRRYWTFCTAGLVFALKADRRPMTMPTVNGQSSYAGGEKLMDHYELPTIRQMIRNMNDVPR